jgi:hypothetical protein
MRLWLLWNSSTLQKSSYNWCKISVFIFSYKASLTVHRLLLCTVWCILCTPCPVYTTGYQATSKSAWSKPRLVISRLIFACFFQFYCLDSHPFYICLCHLSDMLVKRDLLLPDKNENFGNFFYTGLFCLWRHLRLVTTCPSPHQSQFLTITKHHSSLRKLSSPHT